MTDEAWDGGPATKRRKLTTTEAAVDTIFDASIPNRSTELKDESLKVASGLSRPISPPLSRRIRSRMPEPSTPRARQLDQHQQQRPKRTSRTAENSSEEDADKRGRIRILPSPIQLTYIKDLSPAQNVDTVTLSDILGDPLVKECWNFNFLFDLEFFMQHFDPDVRDSVKVKIVHGFWRRDDERREHLQETAEKHTNIDLISAYMPDPFGTHHSKMMILIRHDDLAQVVIHTANMISRDWGNMTQAVWRSPLLPLLPTESQTSTPSDGQVEAGLHQIGTGPRFKRDLMSYLNAYGKRLLDLTKELARYDFSNIQAAFLGSTPSRQKRKDAKPAVQTSWGWLGLQEILSRISSNGESAKSPSIIVIQISSIATLGQTPVWLSHFQSILSNYSSSHDSTLSASPGKPKATAFFTKRELKASSSQKPLDPNFKIIFPTPDEIRTSLDGYNSGGSIHTKTQSPAQQKQLQYLRPLLCHWRYEDARTSNNENMQRRRAERGPAAPHIKTYIRFSDEKQESIDWAMVTSANMSKQAWGEMANKKEEVWIQSWETGVVVWPALFSEQGEEVEMVPVFGKDMPGKGGLIDGKRVGNEDEQNDGTMASKAVIGFRMPYDLPLQSYGKDEVPWCASMPDSELDWKGQAWPGY